MGHCIRSVYPAALLHGSGQHGPAHNEANPSCREPTGPMGINSTQHQAQSQNRSQGLGLGFLYYSWMPHCLYTQNAYINPFHPVISQDIPDELLTLTFWLKVLLHLLSPVTFSALSNAQCFLRFSGGGNNSSELGRLFCS